MLPPVRRNVSLGCLLLAWLCANGALWNVVQVVAWGKMFHDYAQMMPAAQALQLTFDGSKPCALCHLSQSARDSARDQLPRESALGGGDERILLASDGVPGVVVTAPDLEWPGAANDTGPTRLEAVPVPPPRV